MKHNRINQADLGQLLTRAIQGSGKTQAEVAQEANLSDRHLRRLRLATNEGTDHRSTIKILRLLGWTVEELIFYKAPPPKKPPSHPGRRLG